MKTLFVQLTRCSVVAGALLMCLGAASHNTSPPSTAPDAVAAPVTAAVPMTPRDRKFIEDATMGAMAEVELGKLAQIKAVSEPVRRLGARMVEDHGRATVELRQLAQIKRIGVPTAPARSHMRDLQKLNRLSGADFDRHYLAQLLMDHRKDVLEFRKASESAQDSDVKAFADKALPTLQEHLMLAESLHQGVRQQR
jgi:putative membrane protein